MSDEEVRKAMAECDEYERRTLGHRLCDRLGLRYGPTTPQDRVEILIGLVSFVISIFGLCMVLLASRN